MPAQVTNLLLVEDNPADARLLREALAEIADSRFEITHCETLAQAREFLTKNASHVILSDLGLPDCQGLEAIRHLHNLAPGVPIVVLTALNEESFGSQALQEGAQDYLVKGEIDGKLLWRALRYAMERHRVQLGALTLALIDDLTGFNNRRGFLAVAEHHANLAYRTGKTFLLAFVDLDGLKRINDTFGHQEGNRTLVDASIVLRDSFRQSDILARLGGDEFAILVADAAENDIVAVRRRIERKLCSFNADPGRRYRLSFSIGIVASDATQVTDLEQLLSQADVLMYQQKRRNDYSRESLTSSQ